MSTYFPTPKEINDRMLAVIYPTGVYYCDKGQAHGGDYKLIAHLPYSSLILRWDAKIIHPDKHIASLLRKWVLENAQKIISRKGAQFEISTCGQWITLGEK